MDTKSSTNGARRYKVFFGTFATNSVHLRNPWVLAWWSAAFPGFGHLALGMHVKGFILIIWEIIVNTQAKLNQGLLYSFTGQFDKAKEVLDPHWLFLYIGVYVYAIWESYRQCVEINKIYILAERENAPIVPFQLSANDINFLDKRSPWVALVWSVLMPGVGHLYLHRVITGFFVLAWWIAINYYSHVLEAIQYSLTGQFAKAISVANSEWLLFVPSVFCFAFYDAYMIAVESNKLFEEEQQCFFKDHYQQANFRMPI